MRARVSVPLSAIGVLWLTAGVAAARFEAIVDAEAVRASSPRLRFVVIAGENARAAEVERFSVARGATPQIHRPRPGSALGRLRFCLLNNAPVNCRTVRLRAPRATRGRTLVIGRAHGALVQFAPRDRVFLRVRLPATTINPVVSFYRAGQRLFEFPGCEPGHFYGTVTIGGRTWASHSFIGPIRLHRAGLC